MQGESAAWLFVLKAMLSMYIACGLAMALELPSPSMAMLTVLVVMNQQSGMIMAKSFYRIIGTLIGGVAAVTIVALFPQQPMLMLAAIAIWSGVCAAGALMNRGFRGYTFVLAGYTVAMITLPVVNHPAAIFEVAINRLVEVMLGLGVTTLIFDGLFPKQMAAGVKQMARNNRDYLIAEVAAGLAGNSGTPQQLHMESSGKAATLDDQLSNAVFEGPWLSSISRPLRRSNHYFMQSITRLQALRRLQQRLLQQLPNAHQTLQQYLTPVSERLQDSNDQQLIADLQQMQSRLQEQLQQADETASSQLTPTVEIQFAEQYSAEEQQAIATGLALLQQLLKALIRCLHTFELAENYLTDKQPDARYTRFSRVYDPVMILIALVRTTVITFSVGMLWILSGWSSGATGMFIVLALTMMLAPLPNPLAAVKFAVAGHTLAPFIALICFTTLPSLTSYPMLIVGTAPFLMAMLYVVTRPPLIGFGIPLNFGFMVALNIGHTVSLDYGYFFNEMVAAIIGVSMAGIGFALFPGVHGTAGQRRRFQQMLDQSIGMVVHQPLAGLPEQLESRNRDITLLLASQLEAGSTAAQQFMRRSLLTQEACYVLHSLRQQLQSGSLAETEIAQLQQLIGWVGDYWQDGFVKAEGHQRIDASLALLYQNLTSDQQPLATEKRQLRDHLYLLADVLDELQASQQPHQTSKPSDSSGPDLSAKATSRENALAC